MSTAFRPGPAPASRPRSWPGRKPRACADCAAPAPWCWARPSPPSSPTSHPAPPGIPRNPAHTPGGSSSGSAAAVAAGLAPLALGTQTIGSILRPGSFCGVVGVKPTYRRIPTQGVIPLAPSLDHVGYFTADVFGADLAAYVLCDRWNGPAQVRPATLGVPTGPYLDRAGEVALRHFEQALFVAGRGGLLDPPAARPSATSSRSPLDTRRSWQPRPPPSTAIGSRPTAIRYHERTAALIRQGREIDEAHLQESLDEQAATRRHLHTAMDDAGIDLWAAPSTVGPAPAGLESTGDPVMNLPWTQAGLPALTLPCGVEADGLPLGLQLVARWYDDERLLAWAMLAERALDLRLPEPAGSLSTPGAGSA